MNVTVSATVVVSTAGEMATNATRETTTTTCAVPWPPPSAAGSEAVIVTGPPVWRPTTSPRELTVAADGVAEVQVKEEFVRLATTAPLTPKPCAVSWMVPLSASTVSGEGEMWIESTLARIESRPVMPFVEAMSTNGPTPATVTVPDALTVATAPGVALHWKLEIDTESWFASKATA